MFDKLSELKCVKQARQGKVRDIYDLGDRMLLVTSDRVSAFDVVFDQPIKDKGIILNQIAVSIFKATSHIVDNHLISSDVKDYPEEFHQYQDYLEGRSMLVQKTRVIPFECIVRGYISGSAYSEYKKTGTVGGMMIPSEMKESQKFEQPMFTPSTKAEEGHDVNISFRSMKMHMDEWIAEFLKDKSLQLYQFGHDMLLKKGIILADTKFEFGTHQGKIILIDEALTPDSSRFWPIDGYELGISPPSFDKQFIRNYLQDIAWDKQPPAPELPEEVIEQTRDKYLQIHKIITGETL